MKEGQIYSKGRREGTEKGHSIFRVQCGLLCDTPRRPEDNGDKDVQKANGAGMRSFVLRS